MLMRDLGKSGLRVSALGLGLAAIGRPGYITLGRARDLGTDRSVEAMRMRAHDLLDAAYDGGIRYFDAARSYGMAEDFLATWLDKRGFGRDEVTVGSKWGYRYTADWKVGAEVNEIKDHSAAHLRTQFGESSALLGERLCLYQIHSATFESGVLDDKTVLGELRRLKESGTEGGLAIGLTVSGPDQADVIRRALEIGGSRPGDRRGPESLLFDTVQATWNLLEQSAAGALAEAHDAGLGVIVKEALANGRLVAVQAPMPLHDAVAWTGSTLDAVAIAAALAQPWADIVLSGAVTPEQVASNIAGAGLELSPGDLAALATIAEPPESYWATRSALAWT